jgi:hypothetical protein
MDVFLATSRGRGLVDFFGSNPHKIIPGAKIDRLIDEAKKILYRIGRPCPGKHHHIYFVAGLPDVTTMERESSYQEVIFMENDEEADKRLEDIYSKATAEILKLDAIPIFTTIAPCSIEKWNYTRLEQRKTSHLLHFSHYLDMQMNLIKAIHRINKTIIAINSTHKMYTPRLAKQITYMQGGRRKTPRVRYGRLTDGVHPNRETCLKWKEELQKARAINRNHPKTLEREYSTATSAEDDDELHTRPHKRPWRPN